MADELSDDQVFGNGQQTQQSGELTDDHVFGNQELSDEHVFGDQGNQGNQGNQRTWGQEIGRDIRTGARAVLPTVAGLVGGVGAAGLAAETGPGAVVAGLAGGFAASAAAQKAQDAAADWLGIDSPESRAADAANPSVGSTVAEFAPAAIALQPGKIAGSLAQRALSGGIMGAVDIGSQLATKGNVDPTEALTATAAGAILPKARDWVPGAAGFGRAPEAAPGGTGEVAGEGDARVPSDTPVQTGSSARTPGTGRPASGNENATPPTPEEAAAATIHNDVASAAPGKSGDPIPVPGKQNDHAGQGMDAPPGEFGAGHSDIGRDQGKLSVPEAEEGIPGAPTTPGGIQQIEPGELPADVAAVWENKPRIRVPAGSRQVPDETQAQTPQPEGAQGAPGPEQAPGAGPPQAGPEAPPRFQPAWERVPEPASRRPGVGPGGQDILNRSRQPIPGAQQPDQIFGAQNDQAFSPEAIKGARGVGDNGGPPLEPGTETQSAAEQPVFGQRNKPQSLSGAASGAAGWTGGDVAAAKSKIGDAIKNFGPVKAFRQAFTPEFLSEDSGDFAKVVREAQGQTNEQRLLAEHKMNDLTKAINQNSSPEHRQDFLENYEQGTVDKSNPLSRLAPDATKVAQQYDARLRAEDPDQNWKTNFLPRMFADTDAARNWALNTKDDGGTISLGNAMKSGLKLRPELLRQDGKPDPIKVLQAQHNAMDSFLERKAIINKGLETGEGPLYENQGPGLVPINGLTRGEKPLFAEPNVAAMWDRYFGPTAEDPTGKTFYETAQKIKNASVAWQMIGGGYHAFAETQEAMIGDLMRGISQAAAGRFSEAGKKFAGAPLSPYRQARNSAQEAIDTFYDREKASPQQQKIMNLAIKSGFTPERIARYTPDINTTGSRGFFEAWNKGAAQLDLNELGAQARKSPLGAGKSAFQLLGKGMQTVMEPLFNTYIPRLKAGAAWEQMADFVAANQDVHPLEKLGATAKEQKALDDFYVKAFTKILKSTDDRLGELNQSTLFWNRTLKKAANLLMISPGWEVGTLRAAIGGTGSFLKNPASISITHPDFNPNAAWPFAFAIGTAAIGSIYQFLKTGKPPEDVGDPFFPKTGGTAARSNEPERAIMPGYLKDIHGWWHGLTGNEGLSKNASSQLYNKLSLVPRTIWDTMANKDWSGHQIYNPDDPLQKKMGQYLEYVHRNMMPIAQQQLTKGQEGSNISKVEAGFGIRHAPGDVQTPKKSEQGTAAANKKAQQESERFHKRIGF